MAAQEGSQRKKLTAQPVGETEAALEKAKAKAEAAPTPSKDEEQAD